jgi:hypothetical protein
MKLHVEVEKRSLAGQFKPRKLILNFNCRFISSHSAVQAQEGKETLKKLYG